MLKVNKWLRHKKAEVVHEVVLLAALVCDYVRYRKYSCYFPNEASDLANLSAMIIREAHALEKGLSLPDVRLGYGSQRIDRLSELIIRYRRYGGGDNDFAVAKARSVLGECM